MSDGFRRQRRSGGKIAAVHAQIAVVAAMVVGQLWLLTVAWNQLLLGDKAGVVTTALASGWGFAVSLVVLLAFRE